MKFDSSKQNGFTLVELAIVILIVGLLVGGIFGGMKLRENAQSMDIIKQIKLYESSAIKFKELYGELPGDIRNPTSVLENCNAVPCNRAGDGDGFLDTAASTTQWNGAITNTSERFVFWNHLYSAGLISGSMRGTDNLVFGEGQPLLANGDIRGGIRVTYFPAMQVNYQVINRTPHLLFSAGAGNTVAFSTWVQFTIGCPAMEYIDGKIDDGMPTTGSYHHSRGCSDGTYTASTRYNVVAGNYAAFIYITKF